MNTITRSSFAVVALAAFLPSLSTSLRAQGSLTPPAGPPVASMKTLDQVEARTPLVAGAAGVAINAAGTITISQPGSYYLTGNRTVTAPAHGIVVAADDVTLDLSGYSLICKTGTGGTAIRLGESVVQTGVTVRNGTIRGGTTYNQNSEVFTPAGWNEGIFSLGKNIAVEDISVSHCAGSAINLSAGFGTRVDRCSVQECVGMGIQAHNVSHCVVWRSGSTGIFSEDGLITACSATSTAYFAIAIYRNGGGLGGCVSDSHGASYATTAGRYGIFAASVSNSTGFSLNGTGISAAMASNCYGRSTTGDGVEATGNVLNCHGESNTGIGLKAGSAQNSFGQSQSGTAGMDVTGSATNCRGQRSGGVALKAAIAVSCTSAGGTITGNKQLGTP